jgi:HipA-like protein
MPPAARAVTLLHLSDLQFGPHHRFDEAGALGSLLERLRQDLDPLMQRDGLAPDLIVLTGDLTEGGKKSEFDQVLHFARKLAGLVELPPRRVVLIPGNHDVNWKASEAYFNTCEADETEPLRPFWPKLRHYADFFARFYEGEPGIHFTEEEPWSLFEYPELSVVVAGLDSAMAESHRREDHYGFLGEKQLRDFAAKLRPYKEQGYLRIGAVHHDVLHPAQNPQAQQDRRDFEHILRPYLNVVLHGHTHEENLAWLHRTVPVLGIGSASVKQELRAPEVPNEYQIVQLQRGALRYWLRAYIPDQKRWDFSPRAHHGGGGGPVSEAVAFEQAEAAFAPVLEVEEAKPASDLARVVEIYRRHVTTIERMPSMFELIGLDEDREAASALETLGIFVPPWVRAWSPEPIKQEPHEPNVLPSTDAIRRSIEDVVADPSQPWLVLVGAPGSGKTMVTRWLLLELCTPGERIQQLRENLVPVRIEMRLFDASYRSATKRPYGFLDYLDEVHGEKLLPLRDEALRTLAHLGRVLWIFDGLDEVIDEKSQRLYSEMILGLKATYPNNRGLITSRPVGADRVWPLLEGDGCVGYELLDFDVDQVFTFLGRWHSVAFPHAPDVAARRLERLAMTFQDAPDIWLLGGNPLLLTMIAYLDREDELPRHRHQLYQKIVDRMADQWDANKQLPSSPLKRRFSLEDKRAFLRRLAWYMMNEVEGGMNNLVPERVLLQFAARFCRELYDEEPDTARHTAEQLVQHLRERNHVLTFVGGGMFGFIHRTFLEYWVAADVRARLHKQDLDPRAVGEIFRLHWREAEWREILTLLSGLLQEDRPDCVLTALQCVAADGARWDSIVLMEYVGFAIRCLAEVEHVKREPIRSFAAQLTALLEVLSEAGRLDSATGAPVAASNQDTDVRLGAETSLERHRLLQSLLQVGRPRRARVLLHGRAAGVLEETPGGGSFFTYDPPYVTAPGARPLAPNLPLTAARYESGSLHPFFANLLPQGVMLEQTARRLGIRGSDRFGLLLAVGADVMGALQVLPYDDEGPRP